MAERLSESERNKYLEETVIPLFKGMQNQDIYSSLFDVNGRVIMATNKNAVDTGFKTHEELIGLSYADATPELITRVIGDAAKDNTERIIKACQKIHKLLLACVEYKRVVNFIDLIPYKNLFQSYLETYIPIFHPSGEVVAVQSLTAEFKMFDINQLLFVTEVNEIKSRAKTIAIPAEDPPFKLPSRQHEILYLILQGIPQEYAAQILNIKRGTLARIISEQICPKFNIHGSNTKLLIERAMAMGFQHHMPKSLWVPGIIIFDPEIAKLVGAL